MKILKKSKKKTLSKPEKFFLNKMLKKNFFKRKSIQVSKNEKKFKKKSIFHVKQISNMLSSSKTYSFLSNSIDDIKDNDSMNIFKIYIGHQIERKNKKNKKEKENCINWRYKNLLEKIKNRHAVLLKKTPKKRSSKKNEIVRKNLFPQIKTDSKAQNFNKNDIHLKRKINPIFDELNKTVMSSSRMKQNLKRKSKKLKHSLLSIKEKFSDQQKKYKINCYSKVNYFD